MQDKFSVFTVEVSFVDYLVRHCVNIRLFAVLAGLVVVMSGHLLDSENLISFQESTPQIF